MKISYNWLKSYIPELPEAEYLRGVFTFHLCEIEIAYPVDKDFNLVSSYGEDKDKITDWIFDINILPNRAHDLLSHQGVAQELSALLDIEYKSPVEMYKIPKSKPTNLEIKIESDKCRRYMGRIVRNVKVDRSPEWIVERLEFIGQRSINNLVDATNIVMFDCGNPTHVFDAKKIKNQTVVIREASEREAVDLLGSEMTILLSTASYKDLIIADEEAPLAIAGVKGGTRAEVDENTTDIILEVANFDPVSVRKTGRGLSLFTDALKRFENDFSPVRAEYAMRELSALILEMCPEAEFEDIVDVFPEKEKWETQNKIEITSSYINGKLGSKFTDEEIENVWKRMKFEYIKEGGNFVITVPLLRLDLVGRHDLVEEVGRVLGYDRIEPVLPKINFEPKVNDIFYRILSAKKKLVQDGYREVYTYAFTKKGAVEVAYGAKGKEALRTNLKDGLLDSVGFNSTLLPLLKINKFKDLKIFEVGNVFPAPDIEETHIAWNVGEEIKEMTLAEFTKDIQIEDSYNSVIPENSQLVDHSFAPWSVYPFISRDISLWVPADKKEEDVVNIIKENIGDLVSVGPTLVDSFEKEGRKSLAYRLVFQSMDRTLADTDVNVPMQKVSEALVSKGYEIR